MSARCAFNCASWACRCVYCRALFWEVDEDPRELVDDDDVWGAIEEVRVWFVLLVFREVMVTGLGGGELKSGMALACNRCLLDL